MICEKCGRDIAISDWPFCPHGRGTNAVIPDDIPGGQVFENGFDTPQTFYSHSAHRAALAERGLEVRAKWAGPHDQHLSRWDTVDLEAAAVLVTRGEQARREKHERWKGADMPITVTVLEESVKASDLD